MSSPDSASRLHVAVIGGGFCGLAAAYELGRRGVRATVLERDAEVGGLAGSFGTGGARLEKFYHHWFTGDVHVMELIEELGQSAEVVLRPTRTGNYYAHDFFKLSTPLDLLRFSPLPFLDRIRLGLLALRARGVKDWRALEDRAAAEWLREMGGERVYRVVWEPLLRGKFGGERLAYYKVALPLLPTCWAWPSGARRRNPYRRPGHRLAGERRARGRRCHAAGTVGRRRRNRDAGAVCARGWRYQSCLGSAAPMRCCPAGSKL